MMNKVIPNKLKRRIKELKESIGSKKEKNKAWRPDRYPFGEGRSKKYPVDKLKGT